MRLHENKSLFRQAVIATAAQLNIPEIFIEKDCWLTYALHGIFMDQSKMIPKMKNLEK